MTTKSHQPEFVADIVGKTLDRITDKRKRVMFDFVPAENGCMEESKYSMIDRIVSMWGFERVRVIPLEASMKQRFELGGVQFNVYDTVQFSVNGKGWSTDFKTIARDTAYDTVYDEKE